MSEWINVNDRLPEEDGYYLTYIIDNGCNHRMEVQRFFKIPKKEKGIYKDCFIHWQKQSWEDDIVTHWMPLPEVPNETSN